MKIFLYIKFIIKEQKEIKMNKKYNKSHYYYFIFTLFESFFLNDELKWKRFLL